MEIATALDARKMRQETNTRACIAVLLPTVNRTELGDQEWHNSLFLCSFIDPLDLTPHCDVCNAKFSICNSLDCKKCGLITTRHNKIHDGVDDLSVKAFTPLHVRDDPLIHTGCAVQEVNAHTTVTLPTNSPVTIENSDQKGDLLIHNLWKIGTNIIHGMHVLNTDALSYHNKSPEKCLLTGEGEEE